MRVHARNDISNFVRDVKELGITNDQMWDYLRVLRLRPRQRVYLNSLFPNKELNCKLTSLCIDREVITLVKYSLDIFAITTFGEMVYKTSYSDPYLEPQEEEVPTPIEHPEEYVLYLKYLNGDINILDFVRSIGSNTTLEDMKSKAISLGLIEVVNHRPFLTELGRKFITDQREDVMYVDINRVNDIVERDKEVKNQKRNKSLGHGKFSEGDHIEVPVGPNEFVYYKVINCFLVESGDHYKYKLTYSDLNPLTGHINISDLEMLLSQLLIHKRVKAM